MVKNRSRHPPRPSQNLIPSYPHQGRKSHPYQEIASQEGEPRRSTEGREKVRKKRAKKKTKKAINSCGKNCRYQSLPNKFRETNSTTHTRKRIPTMRSMQNFSCRAPSDASSLKNNNSQEIVNILIRSAQSKGNNGHRNTNNIKQIQMAHLFVAVVASPFLASEPSAAASPSGLPGGAGGSARVSGL